MQETTWAVQELFADNTLRLVKHREGITSLKIICEDVVENKFSCLNSGHFIRTRDNKFLVGQFSKKIIDVTSHVKKVLTDSDLESLLGIYTCGWNVIVANAHKACFITVRDGEPSDARVYEYESGIDIITSVLNIGYIKTCNNKLYQFGSSSDEPQEFNLISNVEDIQSIVCNLYAVFVMKEGYVLIKGSVGNSRFRCDNKLVLPAGESIAKICAFDDVCFLIMDSGSCYFVNEQSRQISHLRCTSGYFVENILCAQKTIIIQHDSNKLCTLYSADDSFVSAQAIDLNWPITGRIIKIYVMSSRLRLNTDEGGSYWAYYESAISYSLRGKLDTKTVDKITVFDESPLMGARDKTTIPSARTYIKPKVTK